MGDLTGPPDLAAQAIVVLAHGFGSDRQSRGRFPRLAAALAERGIASLAFDCAGCGESDDDSLTWDKLVDDLRSAVAFARTRFARVALYGHSAGSRLVLQGCDEDIATIVATGAALDGVDYAWDRIFSAAQLELLARTGRVTLARSGARATFTVEKSMIDGFASIDTRTLLARVRCPVLVINGDGDDEERMLTATVGRARAQLPPGSRIEIVSGAPHGFGAQFDRVIALAVPWLLEKLQA